MKIGKSLWCAAAAFAILTSASHMATAANYETNMDTRMTAVEANMQRIEQLEAQLASLRSELASNYGPSLTSSHAGGCDSLGCDSLGCCDSGCLDKCCNDITCGSNGFYAAVEIAVLEAHIGTVRVAGANLTPDFDYEATPRVIIGYENVYGFGVRARYFDYDHAASGVSIIGGLVGGLTLGLEVEAIDLEATQRTEFCSWDMTVAGGLRYGKLGAAIDVPGLGVAATFEGVGPTVALEARRFAGNSGIALFGKTRASLLYGDNNITGTGAAAIINAVNPSVEEQLLQVWEISLGAEYAWQAGNAEAFLAVALEAQAWELAPVFGLLGLDLGFVGPTSTFGLRY
ncbi:MAG: hypothetical protein KDA55_17480 [Planctomycetales bacterium]|nr:hypothetical protein [Planctomycetales bacterium]MCA9165563.1 hypothetical protein [Planctomycetales bacterium]MCA9210156.1 hypothetical protein [Planctomycetales bacterium]MCA9221317.1 hypothetical protein [Planctomycetales bacterium]